MFNKNTSIRNKSLIINLLKFKSMEVHFKYLGLPLGENGTKSNTLNQVVESPRKGLKMEARNLVTSLENVPYKRIIIQ